MTAAARLPRGPGPAPVAAVAGRLLDWVVGWYADRRNDADPDAPAALPTRRYLAGGAPREVAWDLQHGQVHVAIERLLTALDPTVPPAPARSPRRSPGNVGRINRSVALEVQVVRCAPAPPDNPLAIPSSEELHRHGQLLAADAGHLLSAVVDATRDGGLLREHVGQGPVVIGDVITLGPMGGAAGVAVGVTVPLL